MMMMNCISFVETMFLYSQEAIRETAAGHPKTQ